MPTFEVQTDSGTFQIEAPDQNTALGALKSLPSPQNSLAGSAKAIGSGLAEGTMGLAGLPGDAVDLASRGVDAVAGTNTADTIGKVGKYFGSEALKGAVEKRFGELPKPQTTLEKYLHTTAGFAPAMIGGPESLLTKLGTRMIAPGVASEAAGQLAEGTGYEPVARVAGALGGAVAGSKLASAALSPKPVAVPTATENAAIKTAGYQNQAVKDLEINSGYANRVVDQQQNKLARFSDKNPDVAEVKDILEKLRVPQNGITHSIDTDFDGARQQLNKIAGKGGNGATAAQEAIRGIDAATLRIPTSAVVAGDARAASKALFEGRKAAAVEFKDEKVTQALEDARLTAQSTHSGGNLENAIYQQIREWLKKPQVHLRGWNAEERDALRAVLPGHGANALRRVSKVLGGGGGLGQLAAGSAGAGMFGPVGMFALPAMGMGLNKLGSSMAAGRMNNVSETLRARSPAYGKANQAQRQALMAGGIMKGLPEREQLALQALIAARLQSPDYAGR